MDENRLVPREPSELVKQLAGLAKRGLQFVDDFQRIEAVITESDVIPFMRQLSEIRTTIGGPPEEFINGKTANPHDVPSFDLARFLECFNSIRLHEGYVLDYVYAFDGHGGEPLVYARKGNANPISTTNEYYSRFSLPRREMLLGQEPTYEDSRPYLQYLEFDNTTTGCFQFAIFCMTVRRFYLYWHSCYNDRQYILTKEERDHCVKEDTGGLSPEEANILSSVSASPKVQIVGKSSNVALLQFEQDIGYSFLHVHLKHPNTLERLEDEIIIERQSGIFF